MTCFQTLGKSAYKAFQKKAGTALHLEALDRNWEHGLPNWCELTPEVQACWVAVAQ